MYFSKTLVYAFVVAATTALGDESTATISTPHLRKIDPEASANENTTSISAPHTLPQINTEASADEIITSTSTSTTIAIPHLRKINPEVTLHYKEENVTEEFDGKVQKMSMSNRDKDKDDGKLLLMGALSETGRVQIQTKNSEKWYDISSSKTTYTDVSVTADGKGVWAVDDEGWTYYHSNTASSKKLKTVGEKKMKMVVASDKANSNIVGLSPNEVTIYRARGTNSIEWTEFGKNYDKVKDIAITKDAKKVFLVTQSGNIMFRTSSDYNYSRIDQPKGAAESIAVNDEGDVLAVVMETGDLYYCDGFPCKSNEWVKDRGSDQKKKSVTMGGDRETIGFVSNDNVPYYKINAEASEGDKVPANAGWKEIK